MRKGIDDVDAPTEQVARQPDVPTIYFGEIVPIAFALVWNDFVDIRAVLCQIERARKTNQNDVRGRIKPTNFFDGGGFVDEVADASVVEDQNILFARWPPVNGITVVGSREDRLHKIFHVDGVELLSAEHLLKKFLKPVEHEIDVAIGDEIWFQWNHSDQRR